MRFYVDIYNIKTYRLGSLWWNQPIHVQVLDLVWAFVFTWIYFRLPGTIFSVVGGVPVNLEASVVTSATSKFADSVLKR
jgi:hypothetical protein